MEFVAAIVALIAVLAVTAESGRHAASEHRATFEQDEHTVPVDEKFFKACDNTTVIYRDLTRPHMPQRGATDPDASEGSE
jgi:hypothetical protein